MDCDDATLLVAAAEARTLSVSEATKLHAHAEGCTECRVLLEDRGDARQAREAKMLSIVSVPEDALDDRDLLVLPMVDPSVFIGDGELARGGMGRVMRVRDRRLGRDVAVKEVIGPGMRARFEREVMITAKLQHPAIIPIYEAGTWPNGAAFYTMRLVAGGTLGNKIDKTTTIEERLALLPHVVALTDALAYAHSKRIVHRDLKPGNVLVGEFGETVVIDWGLAKELDGPDTTADETRGPVESGLTMAGSVMGTPGYMSPEQANGDDIDERTDVYALGAILYTLLSGHAPYLDDPTIKTAHALLAAAHERPPTALDKLAPRAPPDLRAIAERAMARDKAARYPTAKEMTDELRRFQAGQLLRSREYSTGELIARWIRRHRTAVSVAVVAVVVLAVVAIGSVRAIVARKNQAENALAHSRLEQGHQLLVGGDPSRAAPYLAAAAAALPGDEVVHRLADIALRDADRRIATFHGTAAAFSPDAQVVAIGHADGSIEVVDATTGQTQRTLPAKGGKVTRLEYVGARLVAVAGTGVYLREPDVELVRQNASDVRAVGDRMIVATASGVQLETLAGTIDAHADLAGAHDLDVAPDGHAVLAIGATEIAAFSLPDLHRIATLPGRWWGQWERSGTVLLATDQLLERYALDDVEHPVVLQHGEVQPPIRLSNGDVISANRIVDGDTTRVLVPEPSAIESASIDATHLVTGGFDGTLRVWDLARPAHPIVVFAGGDGVQAFAQSATRLASVGTHDTVVLWDVGKLRAPVVAAHLTGAIGWMATRGKQFAAFVHDPRGDRVEVDDGSHLRELAGWLVGITADGVVINDQSTVSIATERDHFVFGTGMWNAGLSASGARLATNVGPRVAMFDTGARASIGGFDTSQTDIVVIAIDDVGHVVTGHGDGTVRVWDRAGAMLATIHAHEAHISWLEIRGDTLYTSSWDRAVRAWDLTTGALRGTVLSHVDSVALSPDGRTLATAERAGFIDIWDASGRVLERIPTAGIATGVGFSDDTHVMVGNSAGAIEVIDIATPHRSDADIARLSGPLPE